MKRYLDPDQSKWVVTPPSKEPKGDLLNTAQKHKSKKTKKEK